MEDVQSKTILVLITFLLTTGLVPAASAESRCHYTSSQGYFIDVKLPRNSIKTNNWKQFTINCPHGCFEYGERAWCQCQPQEFDKKCQGDEILVTCQQIATRDNKQLYGVSKDVCSEGCHQGLNKCEENVDTGDKIQNFFQKLSQGQLAALRGIDTGQDAPQPTKQKRIEMRVVGGYDKIAADGSSSLHLQIDYPPRSEARDYGCETRYQGRTALKINPRQAACQLTKKRNSKLILTIKPDERLQKPYTINIWATAGQGEKMKTASKEIKVIRPPVVLLHGLWSNASAMKPLKTLLDESGQFELIENINYGPAEATIRNLTESVDLVSKNIDRLLMQAESNGIKTSKVDIVAHSMGGILARLYIEGNGRNLPAHPQTVRKLITLGTPHEGSQLADWYTSLIEQQIYRCRQGDGLRKDKVTKTEFNWFLEMVRDGADMNPEALEFGPAVRQISSVQTPGTIIDVLNRRQEQGQETEYYLLGGNEPIIHPFIARMAEKVVKPLYKLRFSLNRPCNIHWRQSLERMVNELRENINREGTDGVVSLDSALTNKLEAEERVELAENHFSINTNGVAYDHVLDFLTNKMVNFGGYTTFTARSPGSLHVYNQKGEHVGLEEGEKTTQIPGARQITFSDALGQHQFIFVPETEGLSAKFESDREGTASIEITRKPLNGELQQLSLQHISLGSEDTLDLDQSISSLQERGDSGLDLGSISQVNDENKLAQQLGIESSSSLNFDGSFSEIVMASVDDEIKRGSDEKEHVPKEDQETTDASRTVTVTINQTLVKDYVGRELAQVINPIVISSKRFNYLQFKSNDLEGRYRVSFYQGGQQVTPQIRLNKSNFHRLRAWALNQGQIAELPPDKEYTRQEIDRRLKQAIREHIRQFESEKGADREKRDWDSSQLEIRLKRGQRLSSYQQIEIKIKQLTIDQAGLTADLDLDYHNPEIKLRQLMEQPTELENPFARGNISKQAIVNENRLNRAYGQEKTWKAESGKKVKVKRVWLTVKGRLAIAASSGLWHFKIFGQPQLSSKGDKILLHDLEVKAPLGMGGLIKNKVEKSGVIRQPVDFSTIFRDFPLALGNSFDQLESNSNQIQVSASY